MVVRKSEAGSNYEVPGWGNPTPAPAQQAAPETGAWPDDQQIGKPAWTPSAETPAYDAEPGAGAASEPAAAPAATAKKGKGKAATKAPAEKAPKAAKAPKAPKPAPTAAPAAGEGQGDDAGEEPKLRNSIGNAELIKYCERLERLEEEQDVIKEDIKQLYGEIKGAGFDTKVLKFVRKRRAMNPNVRREWDEMVETYEGALDMD